VPYDPINQQTRNRNQSTQNHGLAWCHSEGCTTVLGPWLCAECISLAGWCQSLEEKAANLLYFVTKNHSFYDGNKRIAAAVFLHFLSKNEALFDEGKKRIDDYTLVALTLMIAESQPDEKELMISAVMNCIGFLEYGWKDKW